MNETKFWNVIEDASNRKGGGLADALRELTIEQVAAFESEFRKNMSQAYLFPVLAASFVILSYASDDTFRDFRAWLISKGYQKFENAINDPESISDWLSVEEIDEIEDQEILYKPEEVFVELGGNTEEFHKNVALWPKPPLVEAWPENRKEFRRLFPKLVSKFWNQKKVAELHLD